MRKWFSIAPMLLLAACSRNHPANTTSEVPAAVGEPAPAEIAIPAGTPLHVRIDQTLSTRHNRSGDNFGATLVAPVELDGKIILPQGTRFSGHVTTAKSSGRFKGRAYLGLTLDTFQRNGREYAVTTNSATRVSSAHAKRNAVMIGGGSGIGAAIGAIAGGGKGALIGAGAGAAAGTVGEGLTGKKDVSLPAETHLRFVLTNGISVV